MNVPTHPLKKTRAAAWFGQQHSDNHWGGKKKTDIIEQLPHENEVNRTRQKVRHPV
jgi:hypothetical protein